MVAMRNLMENSRSIFYFVRTNLCEQKIFLVSSSDTCREVRLTGIIIQSLVLIPMALYSVFTIICWIIFLRVQSYVRTLEMMDKEIKQTEN